ncbi:unnamed protein product [Closterium sp. Yama58-4]|nr:unnamed protein product [Closterium sp. Yama58-4]
MTFLPGSNGVVAAVVAAVGVVAAAVVAVAVELFSGEFLAVTRCSCSGVRARPLCLSSFVSGVFSVGQLLRHSVDIFSLDYDAILTAMDALTVGIEGDCYMCVPPDPGIEAAALVPHLHHSLDRLRSPWLTPLAGSCTFLHCAPVLGGSIRLARVAICTCSRTGRHLATFTRRPGSSLYTLTTEPPQVAASGQMATSGQVAPPCECRHLSHQTLLWHHHLGHPSLPRLRGMHSRLLVTGLPRSLPSLPPSPAPPCVPCVEGRQRAAPHSSSFPPTTAPLQTLHMDVWGPVHVTGQGRERYFLLVVDDYSRYTTVFPLRSKGEVPAVLMRVRSLQLRRGGEFSSDLLRDFCQGEGILQLFTLPASPQQNGVAERRIGLVMETSPTLRWTGEVGDASRFRVWGSRAFVRNTTADKLSSRAIPCVFLGFPPDAPGWQFYHPTSCRVFPFEDVTFDESVPFYRLFPYRTAPLPPPPLFLAPGPPPVDPLPPQGPAPSGVSQVDPLPLAEPVEVTGDSGAAGGGPARGATSGGAEPVGAEPGGAEPEHAEPGGAEPGGAELGGAEPGGAETGGAAPEHTEPRGAEPGGTASGGAEPGGAASAGGLPGASPQRSPQREPLSPQQLREWLARHTLLRSRTSTGGAGAGGTGAGGVGAGGARVVGTGTGGTKAGGPDAGDTGAGGTGVGGTDVGATGAGGAGARDAGAGGPVQQREPLSPQQLREWLARRTRRRSRARTGGTGAGGAGAGGAGAEGAGAVGAGAGGHGAGGAGAGGTGAGGAGAGGTGAGGAGAGGAGAGGPDAGGAGAGGTGARGAGAGGAGAGGTGAGGAGARGTGAGGTGAGGTGAGGTRAGGARAGGTSTGATGAGGAGAGGAGAGGPVQQRPFFLPPPQLSELPPESVLRQVLSLPSSTALPPDSPLPAPSRYTEQPVSLTERREHVSRPASPVRHARRVPRPRPPPVPGSHAIALRPSSVPP